MRIRPKTIRRLLLLGIVAVLIGALGIGAVFFRRVQKQRSIASLRTEALANYGDGKFVESLPQLAQYARYKKDDPEVLLALAHARREVETGDGAYLAQAANILRSYRLLEPNDLDAAQELLELYNLIGTFPEAESLSKELLALGDALNQDERITVQLARATALQGINPNDAEAQNLLEQVAKRAPTSFEAQRRYVGGLLQTDPAKACEYARGLVVSNPDPRVAMLSLIACDSEVAKGNPPEPETVRAVQQIVKEADAAVIEDEAFIAAVLSVAAQSRDNRLAIATLKRAAESPSIGSAWSVLYVRKLYELDRFAEAASESHRLLPTAKAKDAADLQAYAVLGRRAASEGSPTAFDQSLLTEAAESLKSAADSNFRIKGWHLALTGIAALDQDKPIFAEEKLTEATKTYPGEPVIRLMLGDALSRLERGEQARVAWNEARRLALEPWPAAELRIVQSLIASGQTRAALDAATAAINGSPNRMTVYLGWLTACGVQLERGLATTQDRIVARNIIDSLDASLVGLDPAFQQAVERTVLPVRVSLLIAEGAGSDVQAALARPPAIAVLEDKTVASQVATLLLGAGLEVPESIAAALNAASSPDTRLMMARALQLARQGKPDEGATLLQTPSGADDRVWAISRAQYAERIARTKEQEEAAATNWSVLFKKYSEDLDVINAVLRSGTAPYDAALITSATDALARLTNASGSAPPSQVVLARAQAVRLGSPTAKQRDAAVGSLEQLVAQEPTNVQARVVLAGLYLLDDRASNITPEPARAADHLLKASELIGGTTADAFRLQGASLFQTTRDFDSARDALFRMLDASADPDSELLWNAGRVLLAQGEPELALRLLSRAQGALPEERQPSLLVSIARAREGMADDAGADEAYRQATQLGLTQPSEVLSAAAYFARTDQEEWRQRALDTLDTLELPQGIAELARARHAEFLRKTAEAEQWYQRALDQDPNRAEAWADLGQLRLGAGDYQGAESAITSGLDLYPDDTRLRILQRQIQAGAGAGGGDIDLNALAGVFAENDSTSRLAEATRAIAALQSSGRLGDRQALIDLAKQYPDVLPLQTLVGRRLMDSDIGDFADAAELMMKAAEYFPAEAEPARLATVAYASTGNFERMQAAALLWRRRDPTQARAADLAIAESAFELKQISRASGIISTYLEPALADTTDVSNLRLVQLWVRIAAQQGALGEVYTRLAPQLSGPGGDGVLASVWLAAVAGTIPDWATAQTWLDVAEPLATEPDQLARLVDACRYRAETGLPDPQAAIDRAVRYAEPIRNTTDPAILTALAELDRVRSDLLRAAGATAEADSMARAAIASMKAAGDGVAPALRAQSLVRAGAIAETIPDLDSAIESYQAALSESDVPAPLLAVAHNNLAFCLHRRDQLGDSAEAIRHVDQALATLPLASFLHTKGKILADEGQLDEAVAALREGLRLDPAHIPTLATLAAALAAGDAGERQEAQSLLQRASGLSRTSMSADVNADLAKARRLLGD